MISAAFPYKKQRRRVLGREMAYVEVGEGDPIVLLHGNPTSSYLWRNMLPHLQPLGRCIAPDLIGMGDSDKLPNSGPGSYRFVEHRRYLDALLEALDVHERVTFVIHDWGSALGFDWANRHREAVKGIAFMEAIVAPQGRDHWDKMGMGPALEALRSEAGEAMVLQNNYFIEEILPNAILRKLSDEEMAEYRRPFAEPGEGRRPTLTWPRQIPIEGEPADVHAIATEYADWLGTSNVPKLFLKAEPGAILANDTLVNLVRGWPALTERTVAGIHFVQEDSPDEIGQCPACRFSLWSYHPHLGDAIAFVGAGMLDQGERLSPEAHYFIRPSIPGSLCRPMSRPSRSSVILARSAPGNASWLRLRPRAQGLQ
jgi:haloalkane dehalogenase